jgi:uncharacterized protein YfbU (UPF0304 family)
VTTVSIRIPDDIKNELEELAIGKGASVSELVRDAIEARLGRDLAPMQTAPSSIPKRDRLILSLLHEILAVLASNDESEAEHHESMAHILQHGYTGEYFEEFTSIHDELSPGDCSLVNDILEMFGVIRRSVDEVGIDAVEANDEQAKRALAFRGFDFNHPLEGRMAAYCRFMIDHGRWTDFAEDFDDRHERGNSHMAMLESYRRMLTAFRPTWDDILRGDTRGRPEYTLTAQELTELVRARYPD